LGKVEASVPLSHGHGYLAANSILGFTRKLMVAVQILELVAQVLAPPIKAAACEMGYGEKGWSLASTMVSAE
jgi:hypothetical protein